MPWPSDELRETHRNDGNRMVIAACENAGTSVDDPSIAMTVRREMLREMSVLSSRYNRCLLTT